MRVITLSLGLTALSHVACAREGVPVSASPPTPSVSEAAAPVAEQATDPALARLAQLAVFDDDFARAELYTWTTVEQLPQLRTTGRLLRADPNADGWASPFTQALIAIERDGSEVARLAALLLDDPELNHHRFAWPSPFATTLGLGTRRYGDSLIRIDLDPRGLIGRFEPAAAQPFSFVDMRGQTVTVADALADPHRIAAFYHLRTPPEAVIAYREYVICNEAMIQSWSFATPEIRARVEVEIELMEQLRAGVLAQLPRPAVLESAAPVWRQSRAADSQRSPLALWQASLAFDNDRYRPSRANLQAITEALRGYQDDDGPPLVRP